MFHYSYDWWVRTLWLSGNNQQNMSGKTVQFGCLKAPQRRKWDVATPHWTHLSLGDLPHPCGSGPLRAQAGGGPCGSREGLVWETARSRVQTWSPVLSVVKMIEARWTHIPAWETFCSSLSSHSRSRFVVLHLLTKLTEVKGIEEKFIPYTDQKLKSETQIVLEGLWQLQVKLGLNSSWFQPFI